MEKQSTATTPTILPGYGITYNHPMGGTSTDRVLRVEGEHLIIPLLRIGTNVVGTKKIHISNVLSYTVYL
jgi:hypothetical protein